MLADRPQRNLVPHDLASSPGGPEKVRGFLPLEPSDSRERLFGKRYGDNLRAVAFSPVMIYRGSQVLQLTSCGSFAHHAGRVARLGRLRGLPWL
jgi:hypothetical protein